MVDKYSELISEVQEALSYNGYDAVKTREVLIDDFSREEVVKAVTIYVMTGNALVNKVQTKKTANLDEAKAYVKFFKSKKIASKKTGVEDLTPSRIALCLPALVAKIRSITKVPGSVSTSTPVHLRDLCFNSFTKYENFSASSDYIEKFSFVLAKALKKDATQEESRERMLQFRALGESGAQNDEVGDSVLKMDPLTMSIDQILTKYGFEDEDDLTSESSKSTKTASVPPPLPVTRPPAPNTTKDEEEKVTKTEFKATNPTDFTQLETKKERELFRPLPEQVEEFRTFLKIEKLSLADSADPRKRDAKETEYMRAFSKWMSEGSI